VNRRRVKRAPLVLVPVAALALAAPAGSAPAARQGDVRFLHRGEAVAVRRTVPGIPGLLESLLAGPTRRERQEGLTSAIPRGTRLREVRIARRVVTVDLAAQFVSGRDERSLQARVGQLVRTVR